MSQNDADNGEKGKRCSDDTPDSACGVGIPCLDRVDFVEVSGFVLDGGSDES
jgi:hypothetical protein